MDGRLEETRIESKSAEQERFEWLISRVCHTTVVGSHETLNIDVNRYDLPALSRSTGTVYYLNGMAKGVHDSRRVSTLI